MNDPEINDPEIIGGSAPSAGKTPKKKIIWPYLVCGGVLVAAAVACIIFFLSVGKASHKALEQRPLDPTEYELIEGMYSAEFVGGDSVAYSSAEISSTGGRRYIVTLYSEYEPLNLKAALMEDGTFRCDTLGLGKISYKPAIETLFIVFNDTKLDKTCVLSK